MVNARIEITQDLDGQPVVLACFDLSEAEIAASAHAVAAARTERYRTAEMGVDDVLAMRELTAVADDLDALARVPGASTVVLRPARLTAFRAALEEYVGARDEADWLREDDARHLPAARSLLLPLADLAADALRAALSPEAFGQRS
jgi:crotonobetainyl-CoA:carnitine CoA-transferase CaiB-like acyl-CoA transferase